MRSPAVDITSMLIIMIMILAGQLVVKASARSSGSRPRRDTAADPRRMHSDRNLELSSYEVPINGQDVERMKKPEREARGIDAVFSSGIRRHEQGGYGSFEPAEAV
jgi:hypothetical protein